MSEYKVLIPLDGSRLAETSLTYLAPLKSLGELHVQLVSVVDVALELRYPGFDEERELNIVSSYVRDLARQVADRLGIEVEAKAECGVPHARVIEAAAAFSPDLTVMTTHGRSGFTRWRLGSVADKLIREAQGSTLLIGPRASGNGGWAESESAAPFRRILVPLDGSGRAEAALPVARRFVAAFGSELHLVRAVPIPMLAAAMESTVAELVEAGMSGAQAYLGEVAARPGFPAATVKALLGNPTEILEGYVVTEGIDLVVMTSHGRTGLVRTALGSVADRMIGGLAPVLMVRAK